MPEGVTRRTGGMVRPPADEGAWQEHHGDAYRCPVYLTEDNGRYTASAATLGGIVAEGATEAEALAKVTAALATSISGHKAAGRPIPWTGPAPEKPGTLTRWVIAKLSEPGGGPAVG